MNTKNVKQILSTTLSLALAMTSAPVTVSASGPMGVAAPAFAAKFAPPEQFGYVASSFSLNKDAKAPRLIVLSDLHAHVEVQHNLIGIMHDLLKKLDPAAGKKVPIFVEGGWEKHLEEPLHMMENSKTRAFLSEYLMQKAQIGSAQAFSEEIAGSGKVRLIGVEDKAAYEGNRKQFVKTYPVRKRLLMALLREEKALRQLSKYIANGSFEKIQSMRDDYNAGRIGADRYAKALLRYAERYHMAGRTVELLQNASQANPNELEVALNKVYRDVALKLSNKAPWTAFLRQSLGNEEMMRQNMARFDSDFDLLKRLVANQLTPAEVPLVIARMPYLKTMGDMLIGDKLGLDARKVIEESVDFYPYAFLRDSILAKNSLNELQAMGDSEATGILVVGGFHTDAILDYLQKNGISYLHINPTITRDMSTQEQINYVKRMGEEPVTADDLKNDLSILNNRGGAAVRGSAIGPVANNQTPQTGDGGIKSELAGGALREALRGLNPVAQLDVLRTQGLSRLGVEADAEAVVNGLDGIADVVSASPDGSVEKARFQNLALKIQQAMAEGSVELRDINLLPGDFTVVLQEGQYKVEGDQVLSVQQRVIVDRINSMPIAPDAPAKIDIFVATDISAKAMDAVAVTLHAQKGEQRAAMVFTQSTVADGVKSSNSEANAAVMLAIHAQAHEASHAVSVGHNEGRAMLVGGIFGGAKIAAATFTEMGPKTAILAYLDAIVPQISLYEGRYPEFAKYFADQNFRVALAEQLAAVIQGPDLSDAQIQKMAENLKKAYPDVPDYVIAKALDGTIHGITSRMASSNLEGDELMAKLEAEAKRLYGKAFAELTDAQQSELRAA